ncbi:DUF4442 domain-containing protein [Flavobacteriaceae bacterium Ap0902]|nr:DUF4442 domain-containing protein [Flavobacteriaceae bacterium Ap0902]
MNAYKFNTIIFFKIPIAWIAGVRLKSFSSEKCATRVRLSRMSQNPFKSMFWAVQGMAAEFTTGFLCMDKVRNSGKNFSMLVIEQNAKFTKKAVGEITFICEEGEKIDNILKQAIQTGKGQTIKLFSQGFDEKGDMVSEFWFLWSFKVKD